MGGLRRAGTRRGVHRQSGSGTLGGRLRGAGPAQAGSLLAGDDAGAWGRGPRLKTIDLTPKWVGLVRFYMAVLEDPDQSEKAKKPARAEIVRLAEFADKVNAKLKEKKR